MSNENEKKSISHEEYEKRVEIEAAHLIYFEYMKKAEARKYIDTKYVVEN